MIGGRCLVRVLPLFHNLYSFYWTVNMTEHRTSNLSALLPIALATGCSEVEPVMEPLKVILSEIQIGQWLM